MTPVHPVCLEGAGVVLREFRADDLDALATTVGDDRVTDSLSFDSRNHAQAAEMLAGIIDRATQDPRTEYYLAVTRPPNDDVVGLCRLELGGVRAAKLGFAIGADHWGHGFATEATTTMVRFGFETLDLHRISAAIGPTNQASLAIANKLGMTHEGRIRDHVFTNNNWRDSLLFSVLAHEWSPRQAR